MREIEFRVWIKSGFDEDIKPFMASVRSINFEEGYIVTDEDNNNWSFNDIILLQYTGLKDKNGLIKIYEGDIIGVNGLIEGNIYENRDIFKETTNFVIQDFGGKNWCATYKKALERGCKHSE